MIKTTLALKILFALMLLFFGFLVIYDVVSLYRLMRNEPVYPVIKMKHTAVRKVALDCNRPQGHHVWTGEIISPQDRSTVMRVTSGDIHEDIDIKGWLCVIVPSYEEDKQ